MKKILIVVDFQNDFVDGALGFEKAKALDEIIYNKINKYREDGWRIAFTFDTHFENYLDTREGKYLPVKHCLFNTDGWKLFGKVAETIQENDPTFHKNTFGSSELFDYLRKSNFDIIELVGLVSNICVVANAILAKTASPNADIIVDASATASFDDEINLKTMDVLEGLQILVNNR